MGPLDQYLPQAKDWSSSLNYGMPQAPSVDNLGGLTQEGFQLTNPALAVAGASPMLAGSAPGSPTQGSWWDGFLTKTDADGQATQGWGGMALGAAMGVGNLWMGGQQLKMAKDSLNESKRQFNLNYDNQAQATNRQLEERQQARIASRPDSGYYQSVGNYMDKNKVKERNA